MNSKGLFLGLVLPLLAAGVLRADKAEDRNKVEDMRVEIPAEVRAVQTVEKLGGHVVRDDKAPGKPVVAVDLSFTQVKDADLKNLAALPQLHTLNLEGTQVTDAGLKNLAPLKQLKEMDLDFLGTSVTNAGLKELWKAHPELRLELWLVEVHGQN